jgi:hypothetical protein
VDRRPGLLAVLAALLAERAPPAVARADPPHRPVTRHLAGVAGLVGEVAVAELSDSPVRLPSEILGRLAKDLLLGLDLRLLRPQLGVLGLEPGQLLGLGLHHHNMVGSMGKVGAAGDNAAMESFFALLQNNVLDRRSWATRQELRIAIVTWIERTYHRRRRQADLGRLTPIEYETIMTTPATQAA